MHHISRLAGLAAFALLGAALYWTVRLERADWLFAAGGPASLREAVRLAPDNPEYASALAQAEPSRAAAILRTSAARNPRNSSLRIELALAEEQQGDFSSAEGHLREAVRLDSGFAPRWALADFYFNFRNSEKFWPAVNAALSVAYGDVTEQFNQCWTFTTDAPAILTRAIPDRPFILRQYLDFLLHTDRLDAAAPVAARVLASAGRDAVPLLLTACDRALDSGRAADALALWNGLAGRNLIPRGPATGALGHCFDWRLSLPAGVSPEEPGLTLHFSGRQPESAALASRYLAVQARNRYVLTIRYRTAGMARESGLSAGLPGVEIPLPGGAGEHQEALDFRTSANQTLTRLLLSYRRTPGATRIEGSWTLEDIALEQR